MEYIKNYNYAPNRFNFNSIGTEEPLFLGVELEVDNGGVDDNVAKSVIGILKEHNVYCMSDGSINDGFEIATHPCTFEYHKKMDYKNAFKYLVKNGYESHNTSTCGIHVHFNKNYFGKEKILQELGLSKLLYLMEKYWDFVTLIARRKENGYARRKYLRADESALDIYVKYKEGNTSGFGQNNCKYNAVNVLHRHSFEIRVFKGTLNYNTFMATLEFVKKLVEFSKYSDILTIQDVAWEDIMETFSDELLEYILDRQEKEKEKETRIKEKVVRQSMLYGSTSTYQPPFMSVDWVSGDAITLTEYNMDYSGQLEAINPEIEYGRLPLPTTLSRSEETEGIRNHITELRTRINRSDNYLETLSLNREINELSVRRRRMR